MGLTFLEILQGYRNASIEPDDFFEAFEKEYKKRILQFLLTQTSDPEQVEDIYQEFLLRVNTSIKTLGNTDSLSSWLFRLAKNSALNYFQATGTRDEKREAISVDIKEPGPGPKTENIQKEIKGLVNQALDGLEPEYRELVYLKYFMNLNLREIAEIASLPLSTVQSRLEKAMNLMYSVMKSLKD